MKRLMTWQCSLQAYMIHASILIGTLSSQCPSTMEQQETSSYTKVRSLWTTAEPTQVYTSTLTQEMPKITTCSTTFLLTHSMQNSRQLFFSMPRTVQLIQHMWHQLFSDLH